MSLCVQQSLTVQNVNVQMMSAFFCIAVQQTYQIFNLFFVCHDKFLLENLRIGINTGDG